MKQQRYLTKQLYSFDFQIKAGNKLLNDKIKIVLGYLIYKTHSFLKDLDQNNYRSSDPYTALSKKKLEKLCGKKGTYLLVLKYLEENDIISWYKSGNGNSKNGSYYSGNVNVYHKGKIAKEPYCRKCRLTTPYWNAVKNNALKLIDVKIPNNELVNDRMFQNSSYDFKSTYTEFDWNEYYNNKKAREDFEKNLQTMSENLKIEAENKEKKEIEEILSMLDDNTSAPPVATVEKKEETDYDLLEMLGDLVSNEPLPPETGVEEEWSFLEGLDVKPAEQSFGKFINIGG